MASESASASTAAVCRDVQPQGCKHYRRKCRVVAPCCGDVFWCQHCHNEVKNTGGSDAHEIDRTSIKQVICQLCFILQPSARQCINCEAIMGSYFCSECNLWDDDGEEKQIFHCDRCGICRMGGRENYFHCDTCGTCYPNEIRDTHTCVENAMHQNCPVCIQDLFKSTLPVTILQCGHTIHQDCLRQLQVSCAGLQSLRCPICNVSLNRYDDVWAEMDRQVTETPMPGEYRNMRIGIICNDCQETSLVPFHVLGHKCPVCSSYNTCRA